MRFVLFCVMVGLVFGGTIAEEKNFDVTTFGAIGDGIADDTQAIQDAFNKCATVKGCHLLFPPNKQFLILPLQMDHCQDTTIEISENTAIIANPDWKKGESASHSLLYFYRCENLRLIGSGTIDGNGKGNWWLDGKDKNDKRPSLIEIVHNEIMYISGVSILNPPRFNILIQRSQKITIDGIKINSSVDSPNTDGVDIVASQEVTVVNSVIENGDDCVAIKSLRNADPSRHIIVRNVTCIGGPLAIGGTVYSGVENVEFRNCTVQGGFLRVKVEENCIGYVKNIKFVDIRLIDPSAVLDVTTHYHSDRKGCDKELGALEYSDTSPGVEKIYFEEIRVEYTRNAVSRNLGRVLCDWNNFCSVYIRDLTIEEPQNSEKEWECAYAVGTQINTNVPALPCKLISQHPLLDLIIFVVLVGGLVAVGVLFVVCFSYGLYKLLKYKRLKIDSRRDCASQIANVELGCDIEITKKDSGSTICDL